MGSAIRILLMALHAAALTALWALFPPPGSLLWLAVAYVLAIWTLAGWITFGAYLLSSWAHFSDVVATSFVASSHAMWLVPGALALSARSPFVMAIGVAIIVNATRLMSLSRPPIGRRPPVRRRREDSEESAPPVSLFAYEPRQIVYFSRETVPGMAGALAVQAGVYALYGSYPLPAAVSFAAATGLWVSSSVAHGAMKARRTPAPYSAIFVALTLLLSVVCTAVLLNKTVVQETPAVTAATALVERPGITTRVLRRLAHVPPEPPPPAPAPPNGGGHRTLLTTVVDPAMGKPAEADAHDERSLNGIPGVILRPRPDATPKISPVVPSVASAAHYRFSATQPLAIPFTGEYQLYRTSSGSLPKGAQVESGTPLDTIYGTTNGGHMETVAVQAFDPPIDLTNCAKLLVAVTSAEQLPVLVLLQLVTEGSVEDGGSDLLGMKPARDQTLEFPVPVTSRPLLVRSLRISFQHPLVDASKNARIEVKGFTLLAR
uniref:Uncharacterized protein n=1 Tax=Solibacter usitatus (strain Ellin6076) TaxID=234267 RepID=Q02B49_SOLUE